MSMYPAPETKRNDDNAVDEEQVYCTNASIVVIGRAICVDLGDAMLPGDEQKKHMSIFFRKGNKWSDEEIALLASEAAAWITKRFGLNAPVTFTIAPWGGSSCFIKGDLESLCLHLRSKFATMSSEDQRPPHVALFKANRGGHGGRGGKGKDSKKDHKEKDGAKTCRICGKPGHFKNDCPMKDDDKKDRKDRKKERKEDKKERKEQRKEHRHGHEEHGHGNGDKQEAKAMKVQEKLQLMIKRVQQIKQLKMQEAQLLDDQEAQFQALLARADELDVKTMNGEIKSIALAFKLKRKEMKHAMPGKSKKRGKGLRGVFGKRGKGGKANKRGHGKKEKDKESKKERKEKKKERKDDKKMEKKAGKEEQRALKQQRKMEKKAEREERKRVKQEKLAKLEAARCDGLPSKADIGGSDTLVVYVDGYNIIGCDPLCRKSMRGRKGGMLKSRTRILLLLQQQFVDKLASLKLDYGVVVHLWFDGSGKDEKVGDIQVTFSTKKQIVDDKLVETLSKNSKKDNAKVMVVTSDRELTLRLHDIGVKVMKSGTFYKSFLKEVEEPAVVEAADDSKDDEKETVEDTQEDQFVMLMAKKLNQSTAGDDTDNDEDDVETPGADSNDVTDDGEETPDGDDAVEGGNDTDGDYSEGGDNDEDDDEEYTAIFGEDFAPDEEN